MRIGTYYNIARSDHSFFGKKNMFNSRFTYIVKVFYFMLP